MRCYEDVSSQSFVFLIFCFLFFLMIRRPPRSTRTDTLSLHDALPILTSVGAQLLVPFAAHLAPDHRRGRIIGNIMSGLMLGILLARPLSRWLTSLFGWRAVFEIMAEIGRAPV